MEEPPAKKVRVHFGSLEEQEKKRLAEEAVTKSEESDATNKIISAAVRAGIEAGNINIDIAEGENLVARSLRLATLITAHAQYSLYIKGQRKIPVACGFELWTSHAVYQLP